MKRIAYLSFIICHLSFSSAVAQNDTLVINDPHKVTIVSNAQPATCRLKILAQVGR